MALKKVENSNRFLNFVDFCAKYELLAVEKRKETDIFYSPQMQPDAN